MLGKLAFLKNILFLKVEQVQVMNFQMLANSKIGIVLGSIIGGKFPSALSYPLINFIAKRLALSNTSSITQVVRNNQKIVHDGRLSSVSLDKAVEAVFVHAGRCFTDLYKKKAPEFIRGE